MPSDKHSSHKSYGEHMESRCDEGEQQSPNIACRDIRKMSVLGGAVPDFQPGSYSHTEEDYDAIEVNVISVEYAGKASPTPDSLSLCL